jgi:hypothetical protein
VQEKQESIRVPAERWRISYRQGRRIHRCYAADGEGGCCIGAGGVSKTGVNTVSRGVCGVGATLAAVKFQAQGKTLDHEMLEWWLLDTVMLQVEQTRSPYWNCREWRSRSGDLV